MNKGKKPQKKKSKQWNEECYQQKMCTFYVRKLIMPLQKSLWKDKESCINLAVIQAGRTHLQGRSYLSTAAFSQN